MKGKIDEIATNIKNKNIRDLYRGINQFKRGYQTRSNLVKDENGDLLADSNNHLNNMFQNLYLLKQNTAVDESLTMENSFVYHTVYTQFCQIRHQNI
jgi:hypothetical protein